MILYLSKCRDKLNSKELRTEWISNHLCLNPKYKVTIQNPHVKILLDSGAFQDTEAEKRLSFQEALNRQLDYEKKIGITSERIVSYDLIGNAEETIKANHFFASKREELRPRQLVLMIQGQTTREYIHCLTETLKVAQPGDCIGFGGVANAGRENEVKFKLLDAFKIGLPITYCAGITDIHVFGVGTFSVLKQIGDLKQIFNLLGIDTTNINLSCDTSAFELNSVMGKVVNEPLEKWDKVYTKEQKFKDYHPAELTAENAKKAMRIIAKI
ncbi:hypothetical protein [Aneurinibacillus migulanus]|uniref:hypothetical protein n=1 Tax=Aneurinibacillus migulanus TaxID=47500 RepID=UPI00209FFB8E|nr:hypothetical protein [Aneurinibacillus migulanus]MCP1355061.1 hypothetical protein [Aneurinibacillus migulanus]